MKTLIVEDDLLCQKFLQGWLRPHGECVAAVNGYEAIDAFKAALQEGHSYDLVCLDSMMPRMDGLEALMAIRRFEKTHGVNEHDHVKIVMISAIDTSHQIQEAFWQGCDAYLIKPIEQRKLIEELKKLDLVLSGAPEPI